MAVPLKNGMLKNPRYINKQIRVIGIFVVIFTTLIVLIPRTNVALVFAVSEQKPNIEASNIYQTQTMVTGKNIKNLAILIPNEAHEDISQTNKQTRLLNQTYLPENAIINVGTTIAWLNADAGHPHSITLVDNNTNNVVYDSGKFNNSTASKPTTLNSTGTFDYSGPSFDRAFPNYKMNGTVTVVNQPLVTPFNTTATATATNSGLSSAAGQTSTINNIDTAAVLITPANLLDKTIADLKSQGIMIDSQYPFTSLRGGGSASGGDKQQVLLVLTSSGKSLNQVTSALAKVVSTLPYK
jgi:plastocyanin